MIRLEEKYEQAVQFRKRGFTYSEISKIVGVSKSTVSAWLASKAFSKKVRTDNTLRAAKDNVKRIGLINKSRKAQRKAHYAEALLAARTEYKHYSKDPRFIAGLMAYIACGDMTDPSRIRLSSSSPLLHRAFIEFAIEFCGIPRTSLRFWILLYQGLNEKKCLHYWTKSVKLSVGQFYKTQYVQQEASKKGLQHGIGNTIIGNTVLKKKLMLWIELFSKEL